MTNIQKSTRYTGVKYFEFKDLGYFKNNKANVILRVNFDDNRFDKCLDIIYEYFYDTPEFTNIDEKIEWVLKKIARFVFDWMYISYIDDSYPNSLGYYIYSILNHWIVSSEYYEGNEKAIHVMEYHCYSEESVREVIMHEISKVGV